MFWEIDYSKSPIINVSIIDHIINDELFDEYCLEILNIFKHSKEINKKLTLIINIKFKEFPKMNYIYKNVKFLKKVKKLGEIYFSKIYYILDNNITKVFLSIVFTLVPPTIEYEIVESIKNISNIYCHDSVVNENSI